MLHDPRSSSISRSLLRRVQDQDPAAWDRLVALYAPLVLNWCSRWQLQPADQADIFQEVFQAVLLHVRSFRREKDGDTFRGWLRTITRNKVRDHFRRLAAEPRGAGGSEACLKLGQLPAPEERTEAEGSGVPGDDAPAEKEARRALFLRALGLIQAEFQPRTWKAFWGTVVESRSSTDVARDLGMSPGAVRVARCRVLRRLREELGE